MLHDPIRTGLALAVAIVLGVGCGAAEPGKPATSAPLDAATRGPDGEAADALQFDMTVLEIAAEVAPVLDMSAADSASPDSSFGGDVTACTSAGCPCLGNADCDSGYCIEAAAGQVCAQSCVTSCPTGLTCKTVSLPGGDSASFCVPSHPRICEPCKLDADCATAVGAASSTCVPYVASNGAQVGAFCGSACDDANPCPTGYSCEQVSSVGGIASKQCRKTDLQCACDGRAIKLGLATVCSSANGQGKCMGSRGCSVAGLSACSAPQAVSETCNDIDDDCDGKTDEADPGVCADGTTCTYDNCVGGVCQHPPATGACDDGSLCTTGDKCSDGKCVGQGIGCDDGNPCTIDSCTPTGGCAAIADDKASCSDGSVCTSGDTCKLGVCLPGAATVCDDGNLCSTDSCDPKAGCVATDNALACNDGDVCTLNDACSKGKCGHSGDLPCSDGNPCTDDSCAAGKGCVFTANTAKCDDNNACTTGEACKAGVCTPDAPSPCDDLNPCTTEICDAKGGCKSVDNTAGCSDDNVCTVGDVCAAGKCLPGKLLPCNDGNPCTDDLCDAQKGCTFANNTGACSDFNSCTEGDLCSAGLCTPGTVKSCDDGNPCTFDTCTAKDGCTHPPSDLPCSDGNPCTVGDACKDGKCAAGLGKSCDDGNPCTTDICDATKGCVAFSNAEPCSDNNVCTDGDLCAGGKCVPGKVKPCSDNNPCTDDSCDGAGGCSSVNNALPCDDGSVCTLGDACTAGACKPGLAVVCNDGNPCTDDSCEATKGCVATPNQAGCSDDNVCTTNDTCKAGKCAPGSTKNCNDLEPCTSDSCDPSGGCVNVANTAPCDDGSVCTLGDVCAQGTCKAGGQASCDDGNPCTDDSCDKVAGCKHAAAVGNCDDGNACTSGDKCGSGKCQSGLQTNCDDGNACTDDVCNAATGCMKTNNTASCSDGSTCTGGDVCAGGVCKAGATINCNDGNPCTDDSCDAAKGCVFANNTAKCDDKNGCTGGDICGGGVCAGKTGCSADAQCAGNANGVACACKAGYSGDGFTCSDVDECKAGTATCPTNTVCSNSVGSYLCTCAPNFAECDGNAANGCEVSLLDDVKNCGKCGAACSNTNIASPTCGAGKCNASCDAGSYDCNGDKQKDGCEFKAAAPSAVTHVPGQTSIVWKWNAMAGATGYRYNTVNNYGTSTQTAATSYTQNGLNPNTGYTLYVWADYSCGASLAATLSATTALSALVLQPNCGSCANMVLVKATQQHAIGGTSYDDAWNNLNSLCSVYGFRGPTTSAGATGLWAHSANPAFPITSDQWNPTYPWMTGALPSGFPGGRIWIASGDPSWLSKATYPTVAPGNSLYTNQGAIQWESYHPQSGGNWNQISSGTIQIGEYLMCAQ